MLRLFICAFAVLLVGCSGDDDPAVDCNSYGLRLEVSAVTDALCGNADGTLTASASGGDGTYEFALNSGDVSTNGQFQGLRAGVYTLSVKDGSMCSVSATVTIGNQDGVNFEDIQLTNAGCDSSNGTISVIATEGTPPYAYALGEENFQGESTFQGLQAGEYLVRLKDAQDCETSQLVKVKSGTSWSTQVEPIIQNNCALASCHGGTQPPDFRNFQNVLSVADRIKELTGNGTMPPNASLSSGSIELIACWVDDGAPDN